MLFCLIDPRDFSFHFSLHFFLKIMQTNEKSIAKKKVYFLPKKPDKPLKQKKSPIFQ